MVLNGQGADELFGGYARYVLLHHEVELGRLPFFAQYTPMARRFWNPQMFGDPGLRYLELNQRVQPRTSLPADTVRQLFSYHPDTVSQMGYTDVVITLQDLIQTGRSRLRACWAGKPVAVPGPSHCRVCLPAAGTFQDPSGRDDEMDLASSGARIRSSGDCRAEGQDGHGQPNRAVAAPGIA